MLLLAIEPNPRFLDHEHEQEHDYDYGAVV